MRITVFGASGAIGQQVVNALARSGHDVTAYVRTPDKVPDGWGPGVRVLVGQLDDEAAVDGAVAGADAVVSALGPSLDRKATGTPLVQGTLNIVAAMKRHGVHRYVGNGTPSILDPQEKPTWQTRLSTLLAKAFLRRAYDELLGMSKAVMDSDLDWTIVRFLAPKDGPAEDRVRTGFFGSDSLGFAVTRADIAAFTAAQVTDRQYVHRAPAISN